MWCGAGKKDGATLHVDHGYYRRGASPWEYENETLWCLCSLCHDEAGRLREEIHRIIARIHPAFLKALGMQLAEINARLEALRTTVRPRWSPIHCRRCGKQIGRHVGVVMRFPDQEVTKSYEDVYHYQLDDEAKVSGRCPHCRLELEFEGVPCVDDYLPSLPSHTHE